MRLRRWGSFGVRLGKEHPEDRRNLLSAAAHNKLTRYVRRLPDTDARLARLAAINDFVSPGTGVLSPGEEASRLVSRFGFDHDEEGSAFLDAFVAAAEQEALARRNEDSSRIVRPVDR